VTQELRSPLRKPQAALRRWRVTHQVHAEQARQEKLWGEQNHGEHVWYPILVEEVGEVGKDLNELAFGCTSEEGEQATLDHMKEELIHVAAVAMTWLEAIERKELLRGA